MQVDATLEGIARELCGLFLGWRLREDREALLALEEGALRVDLTNGECWCDGEPLPALFIAGELRTALAKASQRLPLPITPGTLDAEFSRRVARIRGEERPALYIACRVELHCGEVVASAAANNDTAG